MPKQMRMAATIVATLYISSIIAPLMKTTRGKKQLNGKEGMAAMKGAWAPLTTINAIMSPQKEAQEAKKQSLQTPFLNPNPFQYGIG